MNKQYLRSLQQRAQRLLEISSDEASEEQQKFTNTKTISRRLDLNQILQNNDINQNHNDIKKEFEDYRNTDIQLLKKCISMTNQISQLKKHLKVYELQNSQLKKENKQLQKQLSQTKLQLMNSKNKIDSPYNMLLSDDIKGRGGDQFSFVNHNNSNNNSNSQLSKNKNSRVEHRPQQQQRLKSKSYYKLSQQQETIKSGNIEQRFIYNSNQQSIQQEHQKVIKKLDSRYQKQVQELQQRLKISNQKREALELQMKKQREKSKTLFKFIIQEIPQLKDIVTNLTNKVDYKIEQLFLKDIDQNQPQYDKSHKRMIRDYSKDPNYNQGLDYYQENLNKLNKNYSKKKY